MGDVSIIVPIKYLYKVGVYIGEGIVSECSVLATSTSQAMPAEFIELDEVRSSRL
jgi:hypothetical protein